MPSERARSASRFHRHAAKAQGEWMIRRASRKSTNSTDQAVGVGRAAVQVEREQAQDRRTEDALEAIRPAGQATPSVRKLEEQQRDAERHHQSRPGRFPAACRKLVAKPSTVATAPANARPSRGSPITELGEKPRRVRAEAEERRVAERDDARIAEDEVEREREQREDRDLVQQQDGGAARKQARRRAPRRRRPDRHLARPRARGVAHAPRHAAMASRVPAHRPALRANRPCGRTSSTTIITRR